MWEYGKDRVPTTVEQTPEYNPGPPFEGVTLPLYHHPGTYEGALEAVRQLFTTLRINSEIEGGNIVICFGPDGGVNAFRA